MTTIGDYAFSYCFNLTSIEIPASVTSIGKEAFCDCSGLESISVAAGNPAYDSRNNCNALIETGTNTLIQGCKNTVIPADVTGIGDQAFKDCTELNSITIYAPSLTTYGKEAFAGNLSRQIFVFSDCIDTYKAYAGDMEFLQEAIQPIESINLKDAANNSSLIAAADGYSDCSLNVNLQGRTLYKDGYWNTLVLPFAISDFTGTPLEGATVKKLLTTSNLDNKGVLTLNFSTVTSIEAGKPYIVKWDKSDDLVNPVFTGVTIDKTTRDVDFTGGSFKGTYAPLEITDDNRSKVLLLSGGNKLGYAQTDRTIANGKALGTCRAYFYFPGSQTARSFVMNFGDDDTQTTGIVSTTDSTDSADKAGAIYDLQGRRVEKAKKGLYIVNGKKVLVH